MSSTPSLATLMAAALLASLGAACTSEGPPPGAPPPPPPVRVEQVSLTEVPEQTEYIATIRSRDAAELRAQVTGRILSIHATPGTQVAAGDPLVDIDPTRQRAALDSAEAATESAAAALQRAQADLDALRAQERAREADVDFARQERDRTRELFAADNVSRQEYDRVTAELRRAEAELGVIQAQISAQEATVRSERASVAQSRSGVAQDEAELAYYAVRAPIGGALGDIPVRVGDLVSPSTLLTTIQGGQGLEVYIQVPVEQLPRLRAGQTVELLGPAGDVLVTTQVDFVAADVDPITQTILAKASLPDSATLTSGSFVRARLIWDRVEGPTVPTTAIQRVNTQPFVFVVQDGEPPTVEQRPVQLGHLWNQRYLVNGGLEPGETVVVAGIQRLGDGRPVTIEQPEPPAGESASAAQPEGGEGGTGHP